MKYQETEQYRPRVWIDATVLTSLNYPRTGGWLGSDATGSDPVALQGLTISWGSRDWWSNVEPATLEVELLDPHGDLVELPAGTWIMVHTTGTGSNNNGARALFSGRITSTTAEYQPRQDAKTGVTVSSWLVKITAECPLAELAADRLHGSNKKYNIDDPNKYLHWCETYPQRISKLAERCRFYNLKTAQPAVPGWLHTDPNLFGNVPGINYDFFGYKNDENVSTLTVLRHTARAVYPTNRPYYVPDQNAVRYDCGLPAAAALDPLHPAAAPRVLDANRFILERIQTATGMKNNVSRIGIISRFVDTDRTEYTAVSAADVETQNTVELATHKHLGTPELYLLAEARKALEAVYGLYEYPEITLLPHTAATGQAAAAELDEFLHTAPPYKSSTPSGNPADFAYKVYYLAGSVLNWLKNVEAVTFVGGRIMFISDEWQIRLNPVGVPFKKTGSQIPELRQLSSNVRLQDAAANLNVADLEKTRI